jgi:hypothetical protein
MTFKTITADYTIVSADYLILCNAAGTGAPGVVVTLPAAASVTGRSFRVKRINPVVDASSQNRCFVTPLATRPFRDEAVNVAIGDLLLALLDLGVALKVGILSASCRR